MSSKASLALLPYETLAAMIKQDDNTDEPALSSNVLANLFFDTYSATRTDVCGLENPSFRAPLAANCPDGETCTVCPEGEYFDQRSLACESCSSECQTCEGHSWICTSCAANMRMETILDSILDRVTCVAEDFTNSHPATDPSPCPIGYYEIPRTAGNALSSEETPQGRLDIECIACPNGCETCVYDNTTTVGSGGSAPTFDAPKCTSCKPGFVLNYMTAHHPDASGD